MNILLVSPATPDTFWSFRHIRPLLRRKAACPPLGLLTVAAMLPREWRLKLVDMDVRSLEDADIDWADWIMLSGMIIHTDSCRKVAARCAARGKPVIAGGPLFTTGHDQFPEIPHFVLGEAEDVMSELVADMRHGTARDHFPVRMCSWGLDIAGKASDESPVQAEAGDNRDVPDLVGTKHARDDCRPLKSEEDRPHGVGEAACEH